MDLDQVRPGARDKPQLHPRPLQGGDGQRRGHGLGAAGVVGDQRGLGVRHPQPIDLGKHQVDGGVQVIGGDLANGKGLRGETGLGGDVGQALDLVAPAGFNRCSFALDLGARARLAGRGVRPGAEEGDEGG
jgi:hypothetical protein